MSGNVFNSGCVDLGVVESASVVVAQDESASMGNLVVKARGTKETAKKIRSGVLDVIATKGWQSWTVAQVQRAWNDVHDGEIAGETNIRAALNELSSEELEMKMLNKKKEGSSFFYSFDDPHARPYLRMEIGAKD